VEACVKFAVKHRLCISVLSTGHDYLNRHSCPDGGMLIRTTLMKGMTPDLSDFRESAQGSMRCGPGIVFGELHKAAASLGRYVSSGWAKTVGIGGWSLGGGHGPWAPQAGNGADNLIEVEIVTANGTTVVANSTHNADLWWAVRGGGGSTWGVITTFTLRMHQIPAGGFQTYEFFYAGSACEEGISKLRDVVKGWLNWAQSLDSSWGGLMLMQPTPAPPGSNETCGHAWTVFGVYMHTGDAKAANATWKQFNPGMTPLANVTTHFNTTWEFVQPKALEPIIPRYKTAQWVPRLQRKW